MFLTKELQKIDQVGETAYNLVLEGNLRGARRVLKKIDNSFCVSESQRVIAIIEAKILQCKGELANARARVLQSMGYLWGIPDGLEILNESNPLIDADSSHYYIEILGGLATLGMFTQFSEMHVGSFDVVANSVDEALGYITEVANFADPCAKQVLICTKNPTDESMGTHRGVIQTHPFRIFEGQ